MFESSLPAEYLLIAGWLRGSYPGAVWSRTEALAVLAELAKQPLPRAQETARMLALECRVGGGTISVQRLVDWICAHAYTERLFETRSA